MPKKKNYETRILNRANELARSGRYKGWLHLAIDLQVLHGEPLASQVLDREPIRSDLNQLCTEARKRNQEERHAPWTKEPEETGCVIGTSCFACSPNPASSQSPVSARRSAQRT